ncbi:hypothetical protein [Roseobacter sinensis]|uniref:Uncharacterized protein n=1 Tax=Roseobacter sinensis TaxID=2931391 RepID=A0ABT3BKK9_9RHOB|nr:hypothetical protein [Roseobacter sp. WL0113]MCV3274117.1 hypothetical protein [Roseobacter sp. WL0113]
MAEPRSPLFLERGSYRQRRLMDAIRLLVILGAVLWMIPLLWPSGAGPQEGHEGIPMSRALLYIFGVWVVLIAACYGLARGVQKLPDSTDDTGEV